jgi:hypothetical protein
MKGRQHVGMVDSLGAGILEPNLSGGHVEHVLDHWGELPPQLPWHDDRLRAAVRAERDRLPGRAGSLERCHDLVQPRAGLVRWQHVSHTKTVPE